MHRFSLLSLIVSLLASLLLSGCLATRPEKLARERGIVRDPALTGVSLGAGNVIGSNALQRADTGAVESVQAVEKRRVKVYPGSGRFTREVRPQLPLVKGSGGGVGLNFEAAPLRTVVDTILGELKLNYSIDPGLKGTVTMNTVGKIPHDALFGVLESVLAANRAVIVENPPGFYRVGPRGQANAVKPAVRVGTRLRPGYALQVVRLKHISAPTMVEILKPLAAPDAIVRVDAARGLLILAGSGPELANLIATIQTFDVDLLKGMSVAIISLKYAKADAIAGQLKGLFSGDARSPLAGMMKVVSLPQLNSLMLISPRKEHLEEARKWIERLDRGGEMNGVARHLYVYPVQNGRAERLASLLTQLFDIQTSGAGGSGNRMQTLKPGSTPVTLGSAGAKSSQGAKTASRRNAGSALRGLLRAGQRPSNASGGDQAVRVVADEENNALLILARPRDYGKIEDALRRLDVAPLQVLIEATILEVTLKGELQYGLQWVFNHRLGGDHRGTGILDGNGNTPGLGDLSGFGANGFSYVVSGASGSINAILSALASDSLVKVLSSPSILVLDNHTAHINVGNQQPVKVGTTTTDGGTTTENIQFRDTGVFLEVTPRVNAGGLVTMDLTQKVTDVGGIDDATNQRSFVQREIQSTVAVQSGGSIVLGGLIKDNGEASGSGLPGLHDLPVIGNLFGSTIKANTRQELLVIITPRALRNEQDVLNLGEELRNKMRAINEAYHL